MPEFDQKYSNQLCQVSLRAIEEGWTKINLVELIYEDLKHYEAWRCYDERAPKILEWCAEQSQDKWCEFAGKFYFKNEQDAIMFTLRWCAGK
jgi:hypothetical protein